MGAPAAPKISILMPCRDAEPFLDECIASLEAQTETRFEALVMDDGSVDDTPRVLARWADRDARVRPFAPEGSGIISALQTLAGSARAPFLARMDADDVAHPGRLAAQHALLKAEPVVAACGTEVRYFPPPEPGSGYRRYETWLNSLAAPPELERDLFVECPIAHPTLMVRRRVFDAVGGYRETAGPEDYDLVLRLAAAGHGLANVRGVPHGWRLGPHRLSERSTRYAPEAFRALKIEFLEVEPALVSRPLVIWGAGKVGKAFARAWLRAPARARVAAFVDLDPRKIGQVIHDAPVIAPEDVVGVGDGDVRPYVLAAVGSPGARAEIRSELNRLGFGEIEDYRAVA